MANDPTEQADEAPQAERRRQRGPLEPEPEPHVRPGSLSRTLGHVALTVLAVLVLWTAYQHSRRDDGDDDGESRADAAEGTTVPEGEQEVTVTTVVPGAEVEPTCPPEDGSAERTVAFSERPPMCIDPNRTYVATVETTRGEFEITLDADTAPQMVNNFVFLSRWGYYEGAAFYQVTPRVSISSGDPISQDGYGDPGYTLPDELPPEGDQPLYPEGSVYMLPLAEPNTNASEFSIVTGPDGEGLPREYSRFGRVTGGEDVIERIDATGDSLTGVPSETTLIERITIDER